MNDYLVNLARRGAGLAPAQLARLAYEPNFVADDLQRETPSLDGVGELGQSAQMPSKTLSHILVARSADGIEHQPMAEQRPMMQPPTTEPIRPANQTIMRTPREDDGLASPHRGSASRAIVRSAQASPTEQETRVALNPAQSIQIKSAAETGVRAPQELFVKHVSAPHASVPVVAQATRLATDVGLQPRSPARLETTKSGVTAYVAPSVTDLPASAVNEAFTTGATTEEAAPRIEVRIGRIEMRVNTPPVAEPRPAVERPRGFAGYERARCGEGRNWY